ncbi:MAG TPA: Uma2 family endonuclease [Thermoanaerobaculia bacterium]|nr:Uma2 family endonuclease [Thermoanaerobaculia bacterium]
MKRKKSSGSTFSIARIPRHQIVAQVLWQRLEHVAEAAGGIVFQAPLDVVLADHSVVQPDLLYVSAPHVAIVGDRIQGAPDLLIEILSPGTARLDRGEKLELYARSGVPEYWLVDPESRQVEFLVNEGCRFVAMPPAGGKYRSRNLPEIHIEIASFWRRVEAKLLRLSPRR